LNHHTGGGKSLELAQKNVLLKLGN